MQIHEQDKSRNNQDIEVIEWGRNIYDKVRPIFDLSNTSGIQVEYKDSDRLLGLRPHNRDRVIKVKFDITDEDEIYMSGKEMKLKDIFKAHQAVLEISIINDNDKTGVGGALGINIKRTINDDSLISTMLLPNGQGLNNDSKQTFSIFALVIKLIYRQRIEPLSTTNQL